MILTVVLVVVLALLAGGTAWWLLGPGRRGASDDAVPWRTAWVNGYREAFTIPAPQDRGEGDFAVKRVDGKVVRTLASETSTRVWVYAIDSDQPTLLWENEFDGKQVQPVSWKGKLVHRNLVIDLDTQEVEAAPWSDDVQVTVVDDSAFVCRGNVCSRWDSLDDMVWEATMPVEGSVSFSQLEVGQYVMADFRVGRLTHYLAVDTQTGESVSIEKFAAEDAVPVPLSDGWLTVENGAGKRVYLYEADGTLTESFEIGVSRDFTIFPWKPTKLTREEARTWLEDGEAPWAVGSYEVNPDDPSCSSIIVGGQVVDVGEDETLMFHDLHGPCHGGSPLEVVYRTGGGNVTVFFGQTNGVTGLYFVDVTTGDHAGPIPIENYDYDTSADLIVTFSPDGTVWGYRPSQTGR